MPDYIVCDDSSDDESHCFDCCEDKQFILNLSSIDDYNTDNMSIDNDKVSPQKDIKL